MPRMPRLFGRTNAKTRDRLRPGRPPLVSACPAQRTRRRPPRTAAIWIAGGRLVIAWLACLGAFGVAATYLLSCPMKES